MLHVLYYILQLTWKIIHLMWTTQIQGMCNKGRLVPICSSATSESRIVHFILEADLATTASVHISRAA